MLAVLTKVKNPKIKRVLLVSISFDIDLCIIFLYLSGKDDDRNLLFHLLLIGDTGLEGTLFGLLDLETDRKLLSDVQDTLVSILQAMAADNLTRWLVLIKDVLQASTGRCRATKVKFLFTK